MRKQPRVIPYYDNLRQAIGESHCPLCRLLAQGADGYIDAMLWAMVNDPDSRDTVRHSRGFCHSHAWMLVRGGAALGVTIVMDSVVRKLLEVLDAQATMSNSRFAVNQARYGHRILLGRLEQLLGVAQESWVEWTP